MNLTRAQLLWLQTRGGRDADDVIYDDIPSVYMGDGKAGWMKVEIPPNPIMSVRADGSIRDLSPY